MTTSSNSPQRMNSSAPLLSLQNIGSSYGRIQVLHGVSLSVDEGALVAVIGSNGAGKTTLLKVISGVQPMTGGALAFGGENLASAAADARVRLGISQVPEGRQVFAPLTVSDNLRLGAITRPGDEAQASMERMYETFPALHAKRAELAGNLSGGQQQMVAMARALMSSPKLLLLDEPSMGLSPILVNEIFEVIDRLRAKGVTIVLVEQNADRALSIADSAYVLESGRMVLSGPAHEVRNNAEVRRAYLGA